MISLIVIIGNPAARKSSIKKIERASIFLQKKGFGTKILMTKKRGEATDLAHEMVKKKPFLIIAAGGDGTINEVINGIVHTETPLAILPLGTANVLAKELGISENIYEALETAISRTPKTVSLGRIELLDSSTLKTHYFCLMAGVGFDGKTVYHVNTSLKKVSGKCSYIIGGIKNLSSYSPNELFFNIDGKEYSGYCAIIGKASRYGGNFKVTPEATLLEPTFHSCIFKGRKRSDLLRYVFGIIRGTHIKNDDVICLKSTNIEIQGTAHIQIDGDYLGVTPAKLSVGKEALSLVY
jgi:YegS/Rv2252/BmrU family lipid kinase